MILASTDRQSNEFDPPRMAKGRIPVLLVGMPEKGGYRFLGRLRPSRSRSGPRLVPDRVFCPPWPGGLSVGELRPRGDDPARLVARTLRYAPFPGSWLHTDSQSVPSFQPGPCATSHPKVAPGVQEPAQRFASRLKRWSKREVPDHVVGGEAGRGGTDASRPGLGVAGSVAWWSAIRSAC